jgi:hypothetical protein
MIVRLLLLCLALVPFLTAQAAKKAEEKFEYLLPEGYQDSDAPPPVNKPGLELTVKALQTGIKKYMPEEEDCKAVKFGEAQLFKDGQAMLQTLSLDAAKVDALAEIAEDKKILKLRFYAPVRDEDHQVLIACATYALMRTLQPKYATPQFAHKDTLHLWQEAQTKPFTKGFFFNKFVAQVVPLQVEVF